MKRLVAHIKRAVSRWKLTRAERKVHNVYGYIDNELRQHESQMVWLRDELSKAREAHRLQRVKAGVWGPMNG